MQVILGLLGLLIPVAVVAAVVAVIVAIVRRRQDPGVEVETDGEGIGTVRRLFLYGLMLVSLVFAAVGISMLLGGVFESLAGERLIAESDSELAISLSFTIVGLPAWLLFATMAQRSLVEHPVEAVGSLRWLYLSLARGVALVLVLIHGADVLAFLLRAEDFDGGALGWMLTWAAVWVLHDAVVRRAPASTSEARLLDRVYRYWGTVFGLYMLAFGGLQALTTPARRAYDALFRDTLVLSSQWSEDMRFALALAALGAVAWWWHWLTDMRRDYPSTLWDVYVFLFGILAGVVGAVAAAATLLFFVLQWLIGDPPSETAAQHFSGVVMLTGSFAVTAASWSYHRLVLAEEQEQAARRRSEPERVYRYLVAAAGLVTLAGGLTLAFALAIDALAPADAFLREDGWWGNQLAGAITMLAVGSAVWARYWFSAQGMTTAGGAEERSALSRRVFLFAVLGVAILVSLVNLVIVLFLFFDALLEAGLNAELLRDVRWSVALLLTAGAVSVYYWLILREDQRALPRVAALRTTGPREVLLLATVPLPESLISGLEQTGTRVRVLRRLDVAGQAVPDQQRQDAIRDTLAALEHTRVAVILNPDGSAEIIPFEPGR